MWNHYLSTEVVFNPRRSQVIIQKSPKITNKTVFHTKIHYFKTALESDVFTRLVTVIFFFVTKALSVYGFMNCNRLCFFIIYFSDDVTLQRNQNREPRFEQGKNTTAPLHILR